MSSPALYWGIYKEWQIYNALSPDLSIWYGIKGTARSPNFPSLDSLKAWIDNPENPLQKYAPYIMLIIILVLIFAYAASRKKKRGRPRRVVD